MPLYDYECRKCGRVEEHYASMSQESMRCECGGNMRRLIARSYVNPDIEIVTDDIDGQMRRITSRRQLNKLMAENEVYDKHGKGWW